MRFVIKQSKEVKNETFTKVYLKLIAIEFETTSVKQAKQIYKQEIRNLGIDLTGCDWSQQTEGVSVQTCELFQQPTNIIRVKHNDQITLLYSKEGFKLKQEDDVVKRLENLIECL